MSDIEVVLTIRSDPDSSEDVASRSANIRTLLLERSDEVELLPPPKLESLPSLESRAEPISLAALAVAFLTGGAGKALIDAIRASNSGARDSNLQYDIELAKGKGKIKLTATKLTAEQACGLIDDWNTLICKLTDGTQ